MYVYLFMVLLKTTLAGTKYVFQDTYVYLQ